MDTKKELAEKMLNLTRKFWNGESFIPKYFGKLDLDDIEYTMEYVLLTLGNEVHEYENKVKEEQAPKHKAVIKAEIIRLQKELKTL